MITIAADKTAPTILGTEKVDAATVKVNFSEPLSDKGTWTFKDVAGKTVAVTPEFTIGDSSVTLKITDQDVKAGATITGTVLGAKDQADNLLSPNPATVTFTKGDKDGVAPTVVSATPKGLNKLEVKFSEEVTNLNNENIFVGVNNATKVTPDTTDKTKYEVEFATVAAGTHKVEVKNVDGKTVTDLSGEKLVDFSKLVDFKADTVKPKLVSSEVKVNDQKQEVLVLTFDKDIKNEAVDLSTLVALEVNKDFITTTGTLTAGQLTRNATNNKQLEVVLNTVKYTPASGNARDLAKDATYTITFPAEKIEDTNDNKNDVEFKVTFKRGADGTVTTTDKPKVAASGIKVVDNNTITVKFDKEVDGSTATNVANYSIPGVVIEKATLAPVVSDTQTVTLTLKNDSNTMTGTRELTIQNVKAKNGAVMDKHVENVNLTENVRPTVVSAKFTDTDAATGLVNEITLTFSEKVTKTDAVGFDVYVGRTPQELADTDAEKLIADGTKVVITLKNGIAAADEAKVEVRKASTNDVKDVADPANLLNFTKTSVNR